MRNPLIAALESLGYRRVKDEHPVFAKPMGYACVFVHEQTGEIHCQANGKDGKQHCWNEDKIDTSQNKNAIVHDIAHFEAHKTNITMCHKNNNDKSTYAFITAANVRITFADIV